jgi:hypothetical protein
VTLQEAAALGGIVFGASGLTLSIFVYLRDRTSVRVSLTWDMTALNGRTEQPAAGVIIANAGRRTVFVSHVHLILPNAGKVLLFKASLEGKTLAEGSPPWRLPVIYDEQLLQSLAKNRSKWREVRVAAEDSTGKKWFSPKPSGRSKPPSWATP